MNIKFVVTTAALAVIFAGSAVAAPNDTDKAIGFGSGTGMGTGGGVGSVGGANVGFGSEIQSGGSGAGSQTFGGGFTRQQSAGSGPLSFSSPSSGSGYGSGPALTSPSAPGSGTSGTNPY